MKRYATTYSSGHTVESSSPYEAFNWQHHDEEQKFFLSGKPVTSADFYAAIQLARDAAFDKKNKTHKQVRVLHGSSVACYVTKWIPREAA
jgi:hypothetical protein